MTLMDVTLGVIYQRARETSPGEGIDQHWGTVLPQASHCAVNEIFLVSHRAEVHPPMEQHAALHAQSLTPPDISNLDDGTLALHYNTRVWLLGISIEHWFQTLVDQSFDVTSNTRDIGRWVKPSRIWVPLAPHICHSLVEHYKHYFFGQHCYAELVRRARKNPYMKHTFIQLTDDPDLYKERNEGSKWLREASQRIATSVGAQPEIGEEVKQDWLTELSSLPLHRQVQKAKDTRIEIKHRAYDIQHRKGGQYEHVPFDEDLTNTMPEESPTDSPECIGVEKLRACRSKIEKVLSKGKPKLGKRRFKVLEMLAHTSCQKTIAKQLNISESTITRDIQIIAKARDRIKEALDV